MNLKNIKYPWFLIKFKGDRAMEIEVTGGNLERLPEARIEMVPRKALQVVRERKVEFQRELQHSRPTGPDVVKDIDGRRVL